MDKQFQLTDVICKLGKISNNIEYEGDEEVVVFALPIIGAIVERQTANEIAGDEHFANSVLNDNKGFLEPMPWVREPIRFPEKYDNALATISFGGDESFEFQAARVKDIEQLPTAGGMFALDFQLQIRPELDRANLLLQEYQHREIRLTVADAKIALKKSGKQTNLELVGGGAKEEGEGGDDNGDADGNMPAPVDPDALADTDRLLTKLAELGVRPGIEATSWTERERAVAWEWALAYEADGDECKIARPHWLPIPEQVEGQQQTQGEAA